MKSLVVKRSLVVGRHKTSISLEEQFWLGFKEMASVRNLYLNDLAAEIDTNRGKHNLSSAIRIAVLEFYKSRSVEGAGAALGKADAHAQGNGAAV